jgi:hypothetical protein
VDKWSGVCDGFVPPGIGLGLEARAFEIGGQVAKLANEVGSLRDGHQAIGQLEREFEKLIVGFQVVKAK